MKAKVSKTYLVFIAVLTAIAATVALTSCQKGGESSSQTTTAAASAATQDEAAAATLPEGSGSAKLTESDIAVNETIENAEDGGHAIVADGETLSYANVRVNKTGEADGDEADFYGENAAVYAANGGTLTLKDMVVKTDGTHANAVFSYGEGTTVNIANAYIETSGNCSGGLMTTGGGTMNGQFVGGHPLRQRRRHRECHRRQLHNERHRLACHLLDGGHHRQRRDHDLDRLTGRCGRGQERRHAQ